MRTRTGLVLFGLALLTTASVTFVRADLPVMTHLSERQPPTSEDWFRYFLREQARHECHSPCGQTCAVGPLVLWPEIVYHAYKPCELNPPCGKKSLRGGYGIFHPGPYYIPNPTLAIDPVTRERCACGHESLRVPNNRIEFRLGNWE